MTDLNLLLLRTSRTFALSIPELPEPTRQTITLAYLLFRIADTFEDAANWTRQERVDALRLFARLLQSPSNETLRELLDRLSEDPPCDHEGYLELLEETPAVLEQLAAMDKPARDVLIRHLVRTAEGMADSVERADPDGRLRLKDIDDLRAYCYIVAGIVGELISDVFLLHEPGLEPVREVMEGNAAAFGEGLQLVNILRDADDDAREGRVYLPAGADRAAIFSIARDDLRRAGAYIRALQETGAPRGYVSFCALPVLLAFATLDKVEKEGAGAKISRGEVAEIVAGLNHALDQGRPVIVQ